MGGVAQSRHAYRLTIQFVSDHVLTNVPLYLDAKGHETRFNDVYCCSLAL